jgi:site-specific DNA-cytosine methylase
MDGINVLSLFDGMSCGRIALQRAGIKVNNYFASEIDKHAIKVTQHNYPDTKHIGDVTKVKGADLPKIDLLIGGSPCQGFSFAGKQLNFDDPRSKLFFEFVRLLEETKPKYFLLENVKMKKEHEQVITEYLGVEPILINSALLTAHNRPRLYWTNIPDVEQPNDRGIYFEQIRDLQIENYEYIPNEKTINREHKKNYLQYDINGKGHGSQDQRAYYLKGKHGCLDTGASGKAKVLENDGRVRKITRNEAERLQGVPDNYTIQVSKAQALKMLGNGWTVDVIAHIFNQMAAIADKECWEEKNIITAYMHEPSLKTGT